MPGFSPRCRSICLISFGRHWEGAPDLRMVMAGRSLFQSNRRPEALICMAPWFHRSQTPRMRSSSREGRFPRLRGPGWVRTGLDWWGSLFPCLERGWGSPWCPWDKGFLPRERWLIVRGRSWDWWDPERSHRNFRGYCIPRRAWEVRFLENIASWILS